jgi:DNA-binding HxlR family transcriptional regulator
VLPRDYSDINCSVARTLEVLGDRWTLLIIRNALLGVTRFDDHLRLLDLARNVLADRLTRLTEDGILERVAYQERPLRHEYRVTDKGRDLWPVIAAMVDWGDSYYAPSGPPRLLVHRQCGGVLEQHLSCQACRTTITAADITTRPGPGASKTARPAAQWLDGEVAQSRFAAPQPALAG